MVEKPLQGSVLGVAIMSLKAPCLIEGLLSQRKLVEKSARNLGRGFEK